jgi:endonuclease/exonuclease/phosphatase family metal-dependent hydrolase
MRSLSLAFTLTGALRVFGFFTEPLLSPQEIHGVQGEAARVTAAEHERRLLKIVTWNIERGAEFDPVLRVLRTLDADILLLQEVDRGCRRTGGRDVARDLALALGMNWVSAGEFQEVGEAQGNHPAITGQATLSRFPIGHAEVLRFNAQDRWRWSINPVQPRRGGRIALVAESAGLLLYNTHIESGGNESLQRRQMAEILADQARKAASRVTGVVIGGDFNNGPVRRSPVFGYLTSAAFADALGELGQRGPTSLGQRHPIDWIFVKNVTPLRGRVVDAAAASDHSPVFAALEAASALIAGR